MVSQMNDANRQNIEMNKTHIHSIWVCAFLTLMFVLPIYSQKASRTNRNSQESIKYRVKLGAVITLTVPLLLGRYMNQSIFETYSWLAMTKDNMLKSLFYGIAMTCGLFIGSLYELWLDYQQDGINCFDELDFYSLHFWRTLVVGPIAEEVIFRACMMSVLKEDGYFFWHQVFITSIFFGLAHVHHGIHTYFTINQPVWQSILAQTVLQLTYTALFGIYAAFLYFKTS